MKQREKEFVARNGFYIDVVLLSFMQTRKKRGGGETLQRPREERTGGGREFESKKICIIPSRRDSETSLLAHMFQGMKRG